MAGEQKGADVAPTEDAPSNNRRYDIIFADGKKATALVMTETDPDEIKRGITGIFHPGYVKSITHD